MYIPPVPKAPTDVPLPAAPPDLRWGLARTGGSGGGGLAALPDNPLLAHHSAQPAAPVSLASPAVPTVLSNLAAAISKLIGQTPSQLAELRSRNTPLQNTNLTIGIVVGVFLGLFLIGLLVFLALYRNSVRFSKKRRKGRKGSGSKSSSKSSKSSDAGAPPPPPAPAAPG